MFGGQTVHRQRIRIALLALPLISILAGCSGTGAGRDGNNNDNTAGNQNDNRTDNRNDNGGGNGGGNGTFTGRYFPADSVWYEDVSSAPRDAESDEVIAYLASVGGFGLLTEAAIGRTPRSSCSVQNAVSIRKVGNAKRTATWPLL